MKFSLVFIKSSHIFMMMKNSNSFENLLIIQTFPYSKIHPKSLKIFILILSLLNCSKLFAYLHYFTKIFPNSNIYKPLQYCREPSQIFLYFLKNSSQFHPNIPPFQKYIQNLRKLTLIIARFHKPSKIFQTICKSAPFHENIPSFLNIQKVT